MRSFIALSLFAAVALVDAQSSNSSGNPLIPTNVSSRCSSFLQNLNSNSSVASCIAPVVNATNAFNPFAANSTNATSSAITSALNALCSTQQLSAGCDDSVVRGQLTSMFSACSEELTGASPNEDVMRIYDTLYTIIPLKKAVCGKNDSGSYCVTKISSSSGSSAPPSASVGGSKAFVSSLKSVYKLVQGNLYSFVTAPLTKRGPSDGNTTALVPNTTTFRTSNLPFLFLSASSDSSTLCTSCSRAVLMSYISFEQAVPYARGIANSPMLGGQTDLYNKVVSECGGGFLSGAVQAAGGLSDGLISGARPAIAIVHTGGLVAATAVLLGLVALL